MNERTRVRTERRQVCIKCVEKISSGNTYNEWNAGTDHCAVCTHTHNVGSEAHCLVPSAPLVVPAADEQHTQVEVVFLCSLCPLELGV